jgi:propanol-preferring alcohol dehydrogenase
MKAMLLRRLTDVRDNPQPLSLETIPDPEPAEGEVQVRVSVCAVCHTELDEIEGRTPPPRLPVVPGHQIVGTVSAVGAGVEERTAGERVGVAWVWHTCGRCRYCQSGLENLCPDFMATGRDADGGYAESMTVPADFAIPIPEGLADVQAAPLLCAGAIGYRSLHLAGIADGDRLGLTGFGASAHLVLQLARHQMPETRVHVFARSPEQRAFALELGAAWAGDTQDVPPEPLDAVIDTTPVWMPVVEALKRLAPGGRLVINAIRKEDADQDRLLELDYAEHLWLEKEVKSVANVTRRDVREFLSVAAEIGIDPQVEEFALADANRALVELRIGGGRGAKVLRIGG